MNELKHYHNEFIINIFDDNKVSISKIIKNIELKLILKINNNENFELKLIYDKYNNNNYKPIINEIIKLLTFHILILLFLHEIDIIKSLLFILSK